MKKVICSKAEIMGILSLSEEEFTEYYDEKCIGTVEYPGEVILLIMNVDGYIHYRRHLHDGSYMTFLTMKEFEDSYFG